MQNFFGGIYKFYQASPNFNNITREQKTCTQENYDYKKSHRVNADNYKRNPIIKNNL